jgi:PAS domain S-box-containing protein
MGRRETAVLNEVSTREQRDLRSEYLTPAIKIVLVAAAYYFSARLGLRLALIERNVTPLWPPTGIAVVAFLVLGRGIWPGVALAAFLVNAPISANVGAAAATAGGNTVAPLVAAELLTLAGFDQSLARLRDALAIVLLAALGAMTLSASIGTLTLLASNAISRREFLSAWTVWWTGDAMGVMVVAPFLLSVLSLRRYRRLSWLQQGEAVGWLVAVIVVSILVMRSSLNLTFVVLPLIGVIAWRFQQRGAAPAALVVTVISTWAAAQAYGPFAKGSLFDKMIQLQAFNATVAFTSFVLAAVVSARLQDREALEIAAADLEERVRQRTSELSGVNDRMRREIAERKDAERRLRQRERQLADAQQVGQVGSWEWHIPEDRVTWSDEMYRIHGYRPQEFPITFDKAMELVFEDDAVRIRDNVKAEFRKGRTHDLSPTEYRIRRTDGAERVLLGKSSLKVDATGRPLRMVGTVQDITEDKQAEREHRIAETLQRTFLPDLLPEIPGVMLASRYVAATTDVEVGGDWYDVLQLADGRVGVAIGDVAGHGLRAASAMGQLRMALRAYALEEDAPAPVLRRLHQLVQRLPLDEMATMVYLVFDPDSQTVTFTNAGHPPPLVIGADGSSTYLEEALAPPLGTPASPDVYEERTTELPPGATLLLFTDGLVERRGDSLRHGLERLREQATVAGPDLDTLCDHLLDSLLGREVSDDIAILALRPVPFGETPLVIRVPAEPRVLAPLRHTLRRWLREHHATTQDVNDILVASGEACSNAIQHAYGPIEGSLEVTMTANDDQEIELIVRDWGSWRPTSPAQGGRGLHLMLGLMDAVDVDSRSEGTVVRMRRRLGGRETV